MVKLVLTYTAILLLIKILPYIYKFFFGEFIKIFKAFLKLLNSYLSCILGIIQSEYFLHVNISIIQYNNKFEH